MGAKRGLLLHRYLSISSHAMKFITRNYEDSLPPTVKYAEDILRK